MNVWYSVPDVDGDERYRMPLAGECDITRRIEQEDIAEQCAEHYNHHHDGWECSWPLTFQLFASPTGPLIASVKVDREMEPVFYGRIEK